MTRMFCGERCEVSLVLATRHGAKSRDQRTHMLNDPIVQRLPPLAPLVLVLLASRQRRKYHALLEDRRVRLLDARPAHELLRHE